MQPVNLYNLDGCPDHEKAAQHVRKVLEDLSSTAEMTFIEVIKTEDSDMI